MAEAFPSPRPARREQLSAASLIGAALAAVVVFFPPEGRIMAPLHRAVEASLGGAAFLVPVGLALVGVLSVTRQRCPEARLPIRRLIGLGLLALALVPAEGLLGQPTGLLGAWLASLLSANVGTPLTVVLLLLLVSAGAVLAFNLRLNRHPLGAR
jgi:hypothetical protein